MLPILTYLYGMNALMAVATANLLSMLMKVASSWLHYKLGNIPLRRAMIVLGIMLPATFGASLLVTWLASVPAWQAITEKSINLLVVAAILFSLWLFIQRIFPPPLPADTAETPMSVRELLLRGSPPVWYWEQQGSAAGLWYCRCCCAMRRWISVRLSAPLFCHHPALRLFRYCLYAGRTHGCPSRVVAVCRFPAQYAADQNPAHADAGSRFSVCHADPYPVQRSDDDTESVLNRNHALCL